ncbi:MAG: GNAT family N-acetyltransferase [Pseudomonadota bacterium]
MIALSGTPTLTTERLVLRAPVAGDWPHWRAFFSSERARFVNGGHPENAWRAFGHFMGHWVLRGFGSFVLTRADDPRPLGAAGPWHPEGWPEPEIGWSLWSAEAEGQGYAAEAARACLAHARDALGWPAAVSYIDPENAASIALATRLGARHDPTAQAPFQGDLVYRHWGPA